LKLFGPKWLNQHGGLSKANLRIAMKVVMVRGIVPTSVISEKPFGK